MSDLIFLRALRDKLKGGNTKSIHLNALPGRYATRLDLSNLNYIKSDFAEDFLEALLTKSCFEYKISFDKIDLNSISTDEQKRFGLLSKRLNSINIENDDNFKEHGIKTFGFGYPLLIKPSKLDPKKIIKAPLFIWQLEIIKSTNKINTWSILRNKIKTGNGKIVDEEIHSVGLNEVLLSFLKTDEGIAIPQVNDELLEDAIIDKKELIDECFKVLKALNVNSSESIKESLFTKFNEPLKNIPEGQTIESVTSNLPWIHFGGVFGLFRTQKESIITDIDKLIEKFDDFAFDALEIEKFTGTTLSAIETDPSQQEILGTLGIHPKKIIQGPPGTGKSQSLTALITNALANKLKCLVVCEKKTALEVIKNNLHRENDQLGTLAAVVEDINKDRDGIVNSVRDRLNNFSQNTNFNQVGYNSIKQNIENTVAELNQQHKQLDLSIFQGKNWTELVGEFLKRQKKADQSLLKNKLDYKHFKFQRDENELPEILSKLKTAKKLFAEIERLDHPLEILGDDMFKLDNPRAIQLKLEEISATTSSFLEKLKSDLEGQTLQYKNWLNEHYTDEQRKVLTLTEKLALDILDYKNWLDKHYFEYYEATKKQITNYLEFIKTNHARFGDILYKNNQFSRLKISALSLISSKFKELKNNRILLVENISEIQKVHKKLEYCEHKYYNSSTTPSLKNYVDNIISLNNTIEDWYKSTEAIKISYVKKLSSAYIHPLCFEMKSIVKSTETEFEQLVSLLLNDKQINVSLEVAENHNAKHIQCENITRQFAKIENVIIHYVSVFSSKTLHPFYLNSNSNIQDSEESYDRVFGTIESENILKRHFPKAKNQTERISEASMLLSELKIISSNLDNFREYYDWRSFYISLIPLHQTIIKAIIEINCDDWNAAFESWYFYWLLSLNEQKNLPKSDEKIQELYDSKEQLKKAQIKSILNTWALKQNESVRNAHAQGISPISLFNKRGSKGERRNSLRKIIKTNLELFTDFFPVVMVSPTVCSSILPLDEAIFDLVIFDEASQLRIEDTYPALLRGKIKVISGDSQQMPPSNFFQGGNALLSPTDEDSDEEQIAQELIATNRSANNAIDLADSESLLVYAENSNYKQSYLKVHYRSQHPYLIDFSNHAFYGKRLIPMPAKREYIPIHFIQVNGVYEDSVNRDEARQVVDILLNHIKPLQNGKYPSIGVATFNLYQRNLILEEITKARQLKPEYDKKISDLGSDLFVKNLENIQGDERDIIIISTTFGKRVDGSFRQQFGPILQRNGYKLLNVIVTRAKYKVFVCTSIPQEHISQYSTLLQQFKNNGRAVFYSYLTYAKAVSENNFEVRDSLLKQLYENCELKSFDIENDVYGSESPFEEEVFYRLAERIGQSRMEQQFKIGGFRIDLVIKSKITGKPFIALECDGAKYHSSNEAYAWDMFRESVIKPYGFTFYRIWSTNWWYSSEKELKKLVAFIAKIDSEEKQEMAISVDELFKDEEIIPITQRPEEKNKVKLTSTVTVKNPEGIMLRIRFSKSQSTSNLKPDGNGILTVYERSPLGLAIIGRSEGEACQLGMLELYYEIIKVE